jgi:ankyrin repeat protein
LRPRGTDKEFTVLVSGLRKRIKSGITPVYGPAYYQHALMTAIDAGATILAQILLTEAYVQGKPLIDIHAADEAALSLAIQKKNYEIVELLLKMGSSVRQKDLDHILASDDSALLKLIVYGMPNIDNMKIDSGGTLLHYAVQHGDLPLVKSILARKADINAQDKNGDTALLLSLRLSLNDIFSYLLSSGANLSIKNKHGDSVLTEILRQALIMRGDRSHDIKTDDSKLDVLLENKIGIESFNKIASQEDKLLVAILKNEFNQVRDLIEAGVNVNALFYQNETPLTLAASKGSLLIVGALVGAGAKLDQQTARGNTALSIAALLAIMKLRNLNNKDYLTVVEYLLDHGARIDLGVPSFANLALEFPELKSIYTKAEKK